MIGWGIGTSDPEPQRSVEEKDITWNTHVKIREKFGYPDNDELFADWLVWFYALNQEQRTALRNHPLDTINTEDFPSVPRSPNG